MYSFRTEYRNYSCLIVPFPSCLQIQVFGFSSPAVSSYHCCTAVLKAHVLPARCCVSHLYSCLCAPAGEACREHVVPGEMESAYYYFLSPVTYGCNMMQKEIFPLPTVTSGLQPSLLWIGNELRLLSGELWSPKHCPYRWVAGLVMRVLFTILYPHSAEKLHGQSHRHFSRHIWTQ